METHIYKSSQKYLFLFLIFCAISLSPLTAGQLTVKKPKNDSAMEKQITIRITKDATLKELEGAKQQMMNEGLEFNYSNVVYNKEKEIVSISINYRDSNNNQGKYSVSSEAPINTILITSNGNQISVKSEGSGNKTFINQGKGSNASQKNQKEAKERSAEFEKRRAEMDKKMADRMQSMKERRTQMRTRMENERENTFDEQRIENSSSFNGDYKIVTKNTTNAELLELENIYKTENIIFSHNRLERNANDLITHIAITINNGNGSISTSSFGNGKDAIKNILIGVDQQHSIMKSVE